MIQIYVCYYAILIGTGVFTFQLHESHRTCSPTDGIKGG